MTDIPLAQRFADAMGQLLGPDFPSDIGLAISGGGDSMAMLYLAHNWTRTYKLRLWCVTIDHGLRAESGAEAAMVAGECAALGWPHATLRWSWDGVGNVQDHARQARLALIDRWRGDLRHVLVAHTRDDQAETVLMRLMRGSGVDGLAGMRATRVVSPHAGLPPALGPGEASGQLPPRKTMRAGFSVLRPCLGMDRAELRHYLRVLKGTWVEDPSNENRAYDRVRVRDTLGLLRAQGIDTEGLVQTAQRMARARDALTARLHEAVRHLCQDAPLGQVVVDRDGFAALDTETQLRLLTAALRYVSGAAYRPRASASETLLDQILSGRGGTLHGAEVIVGKASFCVLRELAAVAAVTAPLNDLWDAQWSATPADPASFPADADLRALGDAGWQQIKDEIGRERAYRHALSLLAIWKGTRVIACPGLEFGPKARVMRYVLGQPDAGFEAFCLSH